MALEQCGYREVLIGDVVYGECLSFCSLLWNADDYVLPDRETHLLGHEIAPGALEKIGSRDLRRFCPDGL